jgi:hypothetical protein
MILNLQVSAFYEFLDTSAYLQTMVRKENPVLTIHIVGSLLTMGAQWFDPRQYCFSQTTFFFLKSSIPIYVTALRTKILNLDR